MEAQLQPNGDILLHYGVKGMRWGVRKKRETKGRRRGKKQDNISEKRFRKHATQKANNKGHKAAVAAIALGCTALGAAAIYAHIAHRDAFDSALNHVASSVTRSTSSLQKKAKLVDVRNLTHEIAKGLKPDTGLIMPKGQEFYRITRGKNYGLKDAHGGIYAAFTKTDAETYKRFLIPRSGEGHRVQVTFEATKDLNIPSQKTAEELYRNLMKKDKNYRKDVSRAMYRMLYPSYKQVWGEEEANRQIKRVITSAWKGNDFTFQNTVLTNKGKAYKKYARELAKAGYDGVLDYHDIRDRVADAPVILTNKDKLRVKNVKKLLI